MTTVYPRTINKTTASAVSRFLASNNFERYNGVIGFTVDTEKHYYGVADDIIVLHRSFNNGYISPIGDELRAAGYVIESEVTQPSHRRDDVNITVIAITGRMAN